MIFLSSILTCTSVMFRLQPMLDVGPSAFSGLRQRAATDAGYWVAALSFQLYTEDQLREWRYLVTASQGGLEPVILGVYDDRQAPLVTGSSTGGITHSDGSTHSDGGGYSQSDIAVKLAASLALRATSATFTIVNAGALRRGMYFSITAASGHPRLYLITSVETEDDTATVTFLPPCREAVDVALFDDVEMALPKATMRLASPNTGEMTVRPYYYAEPSIELVESFDGL